MKNKFLILVCTISVLMLFSSCSSLCNTFCNPPKPVTCDPNGVGLISKDTSIELAKNYKSSIESLNNYGKGDSDSRSVWFSYEEMAKYMCILKQEYENSDKFNGDISLSNLGIRIYFGRYPTDDKLKLSDNNDYEVINRRVQEANELIARQNGNSTIVIQEIKYGEKHCVFFVPTYKDGDYQMDFMLDGEFTNKIPSCILVPSINKNHGGLAPPENEPGALYLQY